MPEESFIGQIVKDTLSDFKGTVNAECYYLHEATQCRVVSDKVIDGKIHEEWIAKERLKIDPF